jgi:hypothetical protein
MELGPSLEVANCVATQELPSILWNPKVHYFVHKSPPPAPFLSKIDPVHISLSYLSIVYFNNCLPTYALVFLVVSFFMAFPPISYMHYSSPPVRVTYPAHLTIWTKLPPNIYSCIMHEICMPVWHSVSWPSTTATMFIEVLHYHLGTEACGTPYHCFLDLNVKVCYYYVVCVTLDGGWISEYVYWSLTVRNYK